MRALVTLALVASAVGLMPSAAVASDPSDGAAAPVELRVGGVSDPIGIDDVLSYLAAAPRVGPTAPQEVEIGGPDVLSYGDMVGAMADALGRRRPPMVPFPLITPWLSSLWIGLVTPVDAEVAMPLVEGLRARTVVTDPEPASAFGIEPGSFRFALKRALEEERR